MKRTLLGVVFLAACAGGDADSDTEWSTEVTTVGDTTVVAISGAIPSQRVSTLVPELRIGALDGEEEYTFGRIGTVLGSPDGGLLVHDAGVVQLRKYGPDGLFVGNIGRRGGGPGEYGHVNGIARHQSGDLYVWDAQGGRINRYRSDGSFVASFTSPLTGYFTNGDALRVDERGRVHIWSPMTPIAEGEDRRFGYVATDTAGIVLDSLWFPEWPGGAKPIQVVVPGGMSMYSFPWGASASHDLRPDGALITGPGGEYEFVIQRADGPLLVRREHTPVPVSATESQERRAQIEWSIHRSAPDWTWTGPPIPSAKPAYRRLFAADDNRVWVQLYTAAEEIPEAERVSPPAGQADPPPQLTTREPALFDVFSADGRLLGRVAVPARARVMRMSGQYAFGVLQDEDDVEYAVRFRIEPALPEQP